MGPQFQQNPYGVAPYVPNDDEEEDQLGIGQSQSKVLPYVMAPFSPETLNPFSAAPAPATSAPVSPTPVIPNASPFAPSDTAFNKYQTDESAALPSHETSTKRKLLGILLGGLGGASQYANREPGAAERVGGEIGGNYINSAYNKAMAERNQNLGVDREAVAHEQYQNTQGEAQQRETDTRTFRAGQAANETARLGIDQSRANAEQQHYTNAEAREAARDNKPPAEHFLNPDEFVVDAATHPGKYAPGAVEQVTQGRNALHPQAPGTNQLIWTIPQGGGPATPILINPRTNHAMPANLPPGSQPVAEARTDEANVMQRMNSAQREVDKYISDNPGIEMTKLEPQEKQAISGIFAKYNLQVDAQGNVAPISQQQAVTPGQVGGGPQGAPNSSAGRVLGPAPSGTPEGKSGIWHKGKPDEVRFIVRGGKLIAQ